ncbi:inositol monophosphatase [Halonotius terrestris]|uniref:fructose-bisphosphatase n=1 Tax=Halonotius terrestris TaxID=2487750 RepID=A0A8J8TAQ8_9EURY|nr:inositol monophosphatase [Halonotius terrestris]TQQ79254.1 inositol monophosphatase [Halonotius terrestris]
MNAADDSRPGAAERAATAGAELALESFRTGIATETKESKTDVVTQADRDAQARVIEVIEADYPDEPIVGEEDDALKTVPDEGPAWIVDPIDGTNNFVDDIRVWGTAVAAVEDGEPVGAAVVLPALGDSYTADREAAYLNGTAISVSETNDPEMATVSPLMWWDFDSRDEYAAATREIVTRYDDLRRFGSAQATLALIAAGSLDGGFTNLVSHPWDSVAGVHFIRQAGGKVTDRHGDRWRHDSDGLVVSNGSLHESLLAATRGIED